MANQGNMLQTTDFQAPGMVDLSAGANAAARALNIGVSGLNTMAQTLNNHLADRASFQGKLAGARDGSRIDPMTGELMPLDLPDPDSISIYDQAYRAQALQTYSNVASIQAQGYANVLAEDYRADPVGATNSWESYKRHVLTNLTPEALGLVQPDLISIGNQLITQTTVQATQLERDNSYTIGQQAQKDRIARVQAGMRGLAQGDGGPITTDQLSANISKANETINDQLMQDKHQLDILYRGNPTKFTEGYVQTQMLQNAKDYWSAFITYQAAAFANSPKKVAGDYKRDSDAAQNFANSIPDLVPPGLFDKKELDGLTADAMTTFSHAAAAHSQEDTNATVVAGVDAANTYGDYKTRLEQDYITGAQTDLSMAKLSADLVQLDADRPTFDTNDAQSTAKRKELIATFTARIGQFEENLKKWHVREQINTANSTVTNASHPFTVSGPGQETIMAWDQRQTTVRFNGVLPSATMDTELFKRMHLDDNSGSVYRLGHLYPDEKEQFNSFKPGNDMAANERALNNYDAMMATTRGAQVMQADAPDAALRMETYRNTRGLSKPVEDFNLLMDANSKEGRVYKDERYNSAENYLRRGIGSPHDTAVTPEQGLFEAIQDSGYWNEHINRIWDGMPDIAGAKATPEFVRPGLVGTAIHGIGNAALQAIYLTPSDDITIILDSKTPKAWQAATADAIANQGSTEGVASNTTAMATMGRNNFGPSRLLMSPDFMSSDLIGKALNATYVFGYASPEKWYGLPTYVPVEDMSIKAMRGDWWKKAEQMNPGIIPMGSLPFFSGMGALPPPGSPAFLKREFAEGNLRVQPEGIINGRMEYNVMLRVQGTNKEQWIQYNPQGEFWHYDMQAVGNYADALKGASIGSDAARKLEDKISPYFGPFKIIATGLSHLYGDGKAWEVEYAMKHQEYEAANAWWVEHHGILQNLPEHFATSLPVE